MKIKTEKEIAAGHSGVQIGASDNKGQVISVFTPVSRFHFYRKSYYVQRRIIRTSTPTSTWEVFSYLTGTVNWPNISTTRSINVDKLRRYKHNETKQINKKRQTQSIASRNRKSKFGERRDVIDQIIKNIPK